MWQYNKWKKENSVANAAPTPRYGLPETICKKLREFQATNIDQVILLNQSGKTSHEDICQSLELFAKEVMPEFQQAHPELLEWKQRVLGREIELEEIDTAAFKERFVESSMKLSAPMQRRA